MAHDHFGPVLQFLREFSAGQESGEQPDELLLQRFAKDGDETAFARLLHRYAPMVLGVGQRILGNAADAEDAFQATFFVLARKARSISRPGQLGNWLYGVAYRTALKARTERVRRRRREDRAPERRPADSAQDVVWRDLQPVLDEEVNRLPAKYRAPFLLCHVEGKTNEEAARQLRCPLGTILSRLARARRQLQDRLTRRGVTLSMGLLTTALSREALAAEVSAELMQKTVRSAIGFATVSGITHSFAAILAEGVLQAMFFAKVKAIGVSLLTVALLAGGLSLYAARVPAESAKAGQGVVLSSPAPVPAKQNTGGSGAGTAAQSAQKIKSLLKEKLDTANLEMDARMKEFLAGRGTLDFLFAASRRLLDAQRDVAETKADHIAALEAHWQRMKQIEEIDQERFNSGRIPVQDLAQSKYNRLEAEVWLEKAKAMPEPKK